MTYSINRKKILLPVSELLLLFLLLDLVLLLTHTATITNTITFFISLLCFYILGASVLMHSVLVDLLLPLSFTALSVFIGGLLFSVLLFTPMNPMQIIGIMSVISLSVTLIFKVDLKFSFQQIRYNTFIIILILLALAIVSPWGELSKIINGSQIGNEIYISDSYYFTSIVTSLRHGSIYNAAFETGSAINYQILGSFIPAMWAKLLDISSHQALWGLAILFYKLLNYLMIYELCYYFLRDKVARNNFLFIFLTVFLPILLTPIYPGHFQKIKVIKIIFSGMDFVTHASTITYPVSLIIVFYSLLLFINIDWKIKKTSLDKLLFTVSMGLLITVKMAMLVPYILFIGSIIAMRTVFRKEKIASYLPYMLSAIVIMVIAYKVCYLSWPLVQVVSLKYGYFTGLFADWYYRSSTGILNNIIIFAVIFFTFSWKIGIKLIGLFSLARSKEARLNEFFLAGILSLIGTTLIASVLHMETALNNGALILDSTFNVIQFISSIIYLLDTFAIIGLLLLLYNNNISKNVKYTLIISMVIWSCVTVKALAKKAKSNYTYLTDSYNIPWYEENIKELKTNKYNDGLIAVNPGMKDYGIMLSSSDYGKYWCSMDRSKGHFNLCGKNVYRWQIFNSLIDSPDVHYLLTMKSEGVKYIISVPEDSLQFENISKNFSGYLTKIPGTKYFYQLK